MRTQGRLLVRRHPAVEVHERGAQPRPQAADVGGLAPWRGGAARAEELNLPVVSHLSPEISAHVLAAIPNGLVLEWIPWSFGLFADPPRLTQGVCHLSDRAGFGLTLSPALDRWEDA